MADWTHYKTENCGNGRHRYRVDQVTSILEKESDAFPVYPRIKNISHLLDDSKEYLYINMSIYPLEKDNGLTMFKTTLEPMIKSENKECVIFDFSYDPFDHIYEIVRNWNVDREYFTLLNNFKNIFHCRSTEKYHNPFIWQYKKGIHETFDKERKHLASCLNGVPRKSRVDLFYSLKVTKNFNKMLYSIYPTNRGITDKEENIKYLKLSNSDLDRSIVKNFLDQYGETGFNNFPNDNGYDRGCDHSINHSAYTDCALNVITETSPDNAEFFTEKTWKPIYAKQFFVTFNRPFAIKTLKDLGIDVFDDIIDHSYDLEEDYEKRLDLLVKEIDRLLDVDLLEKHKLHSRRLQHNFDLLTSEDFLK